MKVIYRPRQAGKTLELIKIAEKDNLYIVCPNRSQVYHIAELAKKIGLVIPFPLTWQELIDKQYYSKTINGFLIDNLDQCIQTLSPTVEIKGVSLTNEENK